MRKWKLIFGKGFESILASIKILATVICVASVSVSLKAQEPSVIQPLSTVDSAFSAFDQSLNATANKLLANVRSTATGPATRPDPVQASSGLSLPFVATRDRKKRRNQAVNRVEALRPVLEPILRQEGIPLELVAVVLVESGGQTRALSQKGARGVWQLMPETARRYGLVVTPELDERLDVEKSTHAAAQYLRDLHSQFNDWPLAIAAYNTGEKVIERALIRTTMRDLGYQSIFSRLADETRKYVPAVLNAMGSLERSGLRTTQWRVRRATTVYAVTNVEE